MLERLSRARKRLCSGQPSSYAARVCGRLVPASLGTPDDASADSLSPPRACAEECADGPHWGRSPTLGEGQLSVLCSAGRVRLTRRVADGSALRFGIRTATSTSNAHPTTGCAATVSQPSTSPG